MVIRWSTLEQGTFAQAKDRELAVDSEVAGVYCGVVTYNGEGHCEQLNRVFEVGRVSDSKTLLKLARLDCWWKAIMCPSERGEDVLYRRLDILQSCNLSRPQGYCVLPCIRNGRSQQSVLSRI